MRAKVRSAAPQGRDYPTVLGVAAILLGIAVILGIIFTYADVRQPRGGGISARIGAPNTQQLPSDL
jgi:hypothetical protein